MREERCLMERWRGVGDRRWWAGVWGVRGGWWPSLCDWQEKRFLFFFSLSMSKVDKVRKTRNVMEWEGSKKTGGQETSEWERITGLFQQLGREEERRKVKEMKKASVATCGWRPRTNVREKTLISCGIISSWDVCWKSPLLNTMTSSAYSWSPGPVSRTTWSQIKASIKCGFFSRVDSETIQQI